MPHLFTTETKNYRPLDRRNDYPWEILKERLVRELGNEFATFLAEPVTRANEGFVDWYTELTQPAVPAADLSPEDREKLFERLHAKRSQIYALADKIAAPGRRDTDKRFADAIRRATIVPSNLRFVWSLGGEPTLVLWGMLGLDDERPVEELLAEAVRDPRMPRAAVLEPEIIEPPPLPPQKRRFPYALPLWLLFAALVGVIYYLLFVNCDIAIGPRMTLLRPFGINACTSSFATPDGALRRQALLDRIQHAEVDLARLQGDCEPPQRAYLRSPPPVVTPPPPRVENRPNATDICDQLKARGASCRPDAKLQISLGWNNGDDLDLHVDCPGGTLDRNNEVACGGKDYVDTVVPTPNVPSVENADWVRPPNGRYRVRVELYSKRGRGDSNFTIIIKCGDQIREIPGNLVRADQIATIAEIEYPACR